MSESAKPIVDLDIERTLVHQPLKLTYRISVILIRRLRTDTGDIELVRGTATLDVEPVLPALDGTFEDPTTWREWDIFYPIMIE